MSLHHETELKLDFAARDLDRIRAHPAFASAGPVTRIPLHAIYFDTPARALFARAIALRMRANGVRRVMTLKAENGPSNALAPTRREWEWIVQGTAPRLDWLRSGESGVLLDGIDLDDLTPVFEVKVERVRFEIEPEPGTRVEVAIDTGEIRAGTRYRPVCEIEFELINGRIETLFDMARALLDDIDLRISTMSKAARGFVLVTGAEPPTVKAEPTILPEDASTADAFTQIAVRCLAQIVRNEACALKGVDIEGIHQMRVGLRRLRSLISSFGGLLTSDESHRLRGELCWLAGELGPVRDWDVFISETMKRYAAQPALRPSTIHIAGMAERARGEARSRAEKAIRSQRYTRLLLDLGCWLDGGDWRNGVPDNIADASMRQTVAVWLAARLAKVRLAGYKPKKLTDNGRHALRVQIKKLRYASEFFRSLFPAERGDSFIARVVDVQSVLGQINDAVITRELIAYLGARAGQRLDDSIRILMSEAESERMERIKRLPKVWKKLKKNESFWN